MGLLFGGRTSGTGLSTANLPLLCNREVKMQTQVYGLKSYSREEIAIAGRKKEKNVGLSLAWIPCRE